MIFFSNMELRNSWGWSGRIHAKPKGKHLKLLGCAQHCHCTNLPRPKKSRLSPCDVSHPHLCSWKCLHGSFCSSFSKGATSLGFFSMLWRVKSQTKHNKTTVSPRKHLITQVTNKTPPSTKHSTQQRHLAARLRTSFWHRFLSKKLDSIRRFHLRSCEVWKTCRRASHPPQFLPLQQWPPLRTALLLFPIASDMHRMDFLRVGYQKHICSELLPRSSDFW